MFIIKEKQLKIMMIHKQTKTKQCFLKEIKKYDVKYRRDLIYNNINF